MGAGTKSRHSDKDVDIEQLSTYGRLNNKMEKRLSSKGNFFE